MIDGLPDDWQEPLGDVSLRRDLLLIFCLAATLGCAFGLRGCVSAEGGGQNGVANQSQTAGTQQQGLLNVHRTVEATGAGSDRWTSRLIALSLFAAVVTLAAAWWWRRRCRHRKAFGEDGRIT